ncbi:sulfite exporter TauE/SafE family protein [Dickeya lacustris]|uniref:Probable membrane transporter protein n=1 Tax=Dickeya lacustris TaxID=2259638 RepID=A0ABY8G9Y6_9GAMM|nr:sulfite exporter TauE/SafE family protein [Dickeya lacustris]WFN56725.1 sulfite exporter TauE/SafE family protein [Dickeya lacustris]
MEWFVVGPDILILLFLASVIAGFVDSIAGGGGLLSIPVLLAAGLSPAQVLATNKLQAVGGSFSASLYFIRRRAVDMKVLRLAVPLTFIGAVFGAWLIQQIHADFLRRLLPVLVIGIGLYFLLMPKIGEGDRHARVGMLVFSLLGGASVGFYDGFFGPGAGSFYALAYVMLLGFNLSKATAHAKVLNFTSNFGSLLFFILGGQVVWGIGLVMLVGQIIGARLGAKMVLTRGQKLIRPMLVIMSALMSIKLIHDNHGSDIARWLGQLF